MNGNVLVLGGAGYIGAHVCKRLFKENFTPIVFDNLIYGHQEFIKWGDFVLGDLKDPAQVRIAFEQYEIDAVMHFAAYSNVGESVKDPAKYYENNVIGTLNLLEIMREFSVDKLVFSSTCATYGAPAYIPIDEGHSQYPINPYGQSKLMAEKILLDYQQAYNLNFVSLRYFNASGCDWEGEIGERHDPETHLIPLVLDAAIGRRPDIQVFGNNYDTPDGTCVRDYIHVEDLAEAHVLALNQLLNGGESNFYNLGNGQGFSVDEVINCAREITGKDIKAVYVGRRPGDPARLVGSSKKIFDELNWKPKYSKLSEIILSAWLWHNRLFSSESAVKLNAEADLLQ